MILAEIMVPSGGQVPWLAPWPSPADADGAPPRPTAVSSGSMDLGGSTGFEGVYSSGDGFGADLRKGSKRLRQTGFRSPFEAALERARWAKLADPGPDPGTSTRLSSAQSQTQSLPW